MTFKTEMASLFVSMPFIRDAALQSNTMNEIMQDKSKNAVASFRLPVNVLEKLRHGARIKNLSLNSHVTQILYSHIDVYEPSCAAGMFPFPKKAVSSMLDTMDEKQIVELSKQMAYNDLVHLAYMSPNSHDGNSFINTVLNWARHSGFQVQDMEVDGARTIVIKHDMGEKWSFFLSESLQKYLNYVKISQVRFEIPNNMLVMRLIAK